MNRRQIVARVRSRPRDLSNSIFREVDVVDYINEAIDRVMQIIPQMQKMQHLRANEQVPKLLPRRYHHLLAVYSASRCFSQDERHYQATNLMNEFELKMDELKVAIENGDVIIVDDDGKPVVLDNIADHVHDVYFARTRYREEW